MLDFSWRIALFNALAAVPSIAAPQATATLPSRPSWQRRKPPKFEEWELNDCPELGAGKGARTSACGSSKLPVGQRPVAAVRGGVVVDELLPYERKAD